jgi:hypothetical protein
MMDVPLRPPQKVMQLERMGARYQTRLSFMRTVLRRLRKEQWTVEQRQADWDDAGYGTAVYRAKGPNHTYSLVAYSRHLEAAERSDRVIAEKWDAAFTLFDGDPTRADIDRLRENVPRQEAGRLSVSELTLSRANKSVRLFEHVVDSLASGRQPDLERIGQTGYLMRTTAVYGNGKFGLADRDLTCHRRELAAPYQAELLTVYLIRCFTHDLVEHIARRRDPEKFVPLNPDIRRHLGIGNSTGLGMAPFLYHHPILINNWISAVETALAAVRSVEHIDGRKKSAFKDLVARAGVMSREWNVEDSRQMQRVMQLRADLDLLSQRLSDSEWFEHDRPWDAIYRWAEDNLSIEAQEMIVSLLIEMHPEKADHLETTMGTTDTLDIQPAMTLGELKSRIESDYRWALQIDFGDPAATHYFWYASEEKLEPRLGERRSEPGAEREHLLTAARDVTTLYHDLRYADENHTVAEFLLRQPQHRHIVRRVQSLSKYRYAEIQDNLLGAGLLPIDMLRFKLSFFGATKFDPKSDKWTRINMYQGAPLPDEIGEPDSDRWMLLPQAPRTRGQA